MLGGSAAAGDLLDHLLQIAAHAFDVIEIEVGGSTLDVDRFLAVVGPKTLIVEVIEPQPQDSLVVDGRFREDAANVGDLGRDRGLDDEMEF